MRHFFWRQRGLSDFAEAIRPELRAIATPEPSRQLLERILASRADGLRIILPELVLEPRVAKRSIMRFTIAAAVLLVVLPVIQHSPPNADDIVAPSAFFAREVFAQPRNAEARAGLPPLKLMRPAAIRPLALEFSRRIRDTAGQLTSQSTDTLRVAAVDMDGTPAWRVASVAHDVARSQLRVRTETLYVARADLRMLRRTVHVSPYSRFDRINVEQRFTGDSVTGRMTTDGPSIGVGRAIAQALHAEFAPYLTDTFAPLALMAAPLSSTWQTRASLLGWAVRRDDVFSPIELRVEGEDRVQVPAGTFDCWRLSIRFGRTEITYWARKSDGLGVRLFDRLDSAANGSREVLLTRVEE